MWKNRSLSCSYKQNLMQVVSLSVTANMRLIYCLSNIVEGKTYVKFISVWFISLGKLYFTVSSCSVFSCREMEDISSVSRVAFGKRKKHVPNAIAESEGSNSTAFMDR